MLTKEYGFSKDINLSIACESFKDYEIAATLNQHKKLGVPWMVVSHGNILMNLYIHGDKTMTEIAEYIRKTAPTTTTLVKKLKKEGMVTSKKDKEDSRKSVISITEKGRAHCKNMKVFLFDLSSAFRKGIEDEDMIRTVALIHKVVDNIIAFEAEQLALNEKD